MKLAQRIAIRRSIQTRRAAVVDVPVVAETVKKPRTERQLASDAQFGEMVRARRDAQRAAAESLAA